MYSSHFYWIGHYETAVTFSENDSYCKYYYSYTVTCSRAHAGFSFCPYPMVTMYHCLALPTPLHPLFLICLPSVPASWMLTPCEGLKMDNSKTNWWSPNVCKMLSLSHPRSITLHYGTIHSSYILPSVKLFVYLYFLLLAKNSISKA